MLSSCLCCPSKHCTVTNSSVLPTIVVALREKGEKNGGREVNSLWSISSSLAEVNINHDFNCIQATHNWFKTIVKHKTKHLKHWPLCRLVTHSGTLSDSPNFTILPWIIFTPAALSLICLVVGKCCRGFFSPSSSSSNFVSQSSSLPFSPRPGKDILIWFSTQRKDVYKSRELLGKPCFFDCLFSTPFNWSTDQLVTKADADLLPPSLVHWQEFILAKLKMICPYEDTIKSANECF